MTAAEVAAIASAPINAEIQVKIDAYEAAKQDADAAFVECLLVELRHILEALGIR
ncbi:MAG: hypothetical protein IBJ10_07745 [Phycisphaerales bacterium]|nr:hypothetical protein [Phycisphaerales bacterium]